MQRHRLRSILLLTGLALLAGCANRDPYRRTDVWQPTGSNASNIAAMVANPHDLARGHTEGKQLAKAPELAVEHVWAGPGGAGSSGGGGSLGGGGGGSSGGGAGGSGAPGASGG
jgi:uncharacterized membrane protein YgcG